MGNNVGVVWNDSPFPIEYIVYGKFEEISNSTMESQIDPNIKIGLDTKIDAELSGFKLKKNSGINAKYDNSFVRVLPTRHSTSGLSNL